MLAIRVELNGVLFCTAGIKGGGSAMVHVMASKRNGEEGAAGVYSDGHVMVPVNRVEEKMERVLFRELTRLAVGDEIRMRIVDVDTIDEPRPPPPPDPSVVKMHRKRARRRGLDYNSSLALHVIDWFRWKWGW